MQNIRVTLPQQSIETLRKMQNASATILQRISDAIDFQNELTVSHIQAAYLSFSKSSPANETGLRVQSGSLRRSLHREPSVIVEKRVVSAIGNNVTSHGINYAAVHEFGATIPPHTVHAKPGHPMVFRIGDRVIFSMTAKNPGFQLPARAPMQRGITDRIQNYQQEVAKAVLTYE